MDKGLINSADTKVSLKAHLGAILVTPPPDSEFVTNTSIFLRG